MSRFAFRLLAVAFISVASSAQALAFQERAFLSASSLALGGTGRASLNYIDSISLNPAGLAFSPSNQIGFTIRGQRAVEYEPQTLDLAGIAIDAGPDRFFPGSVVVARSQREWSGGGAVDVLTGELSLGFGLLPGQLGFGTTLVYARANGRDGLAIPKDAQELWNLRLGALWLPTSWIAIALVGQNLVEPSASTPEQIVTVPTLELGISTGWSEFFRWRLDLISPRARNPQNRTNLLVGLEIPMLGDFVFRSGYRWLEVSDRQELTLGFGWNGPRLKFSYGLSRARPRENNAEIAALARHSIDLWVPF